MSSPMTYANEALAPAADATFHNKRALPFVQSKFFVATTDTQAQQVLVVHNRSHSEEQVQEARQLVETHSGVGCCLVPVGSSKRSCPSASTFFGSGAVQHIKELCAAKKYELVVVDAELSGIQQRNLESVWGCHVIDRVGLIIKIFAQRARTRDARLQVEMGALHYRASRLVRTLDSKTGKRRGFGAAGDGEIVSARERGRSGSTSGGLGGAGGGGETELQLQRRRIGARMKAIQRKLDEVRRTRGVQRQGRSRHGCPVVAVVGYTSAGKSSLISALSGQNLAAHDRLFETLDPVLRRIRLPSGNAIFASDTVGFISDLPHSLISAFQATLEEVKEADLLIHVLDASSRNVANQRRAVLSVLRELGISEHRLSNRTLEVWNKMDLVEESSNVTSSGGSYQSPEDLRDFPGYKDQLPEYDMNEQSSEGSESRSPAESASNLAAASAPCGDPNLLEEAENMHSIWDQIQDIHRQQADVQPVAVPVSSLTGDGLQALLHQIDRMVCPLHRPKVVSSSACLPTSSFATASGTDLSLGNLWAPDALEK